MALLLVKGEMSLRLRLAELHSFEESFASDKGTFTIEDKTRPTKVSEIWKWESYTPETGGTASKYMKASAYISATEKEASESWLISPVVNLTKSDQSLH